ncbi:nucleoside triphosphate pyrophosphohydrolase [Robertmurraya massiliosenegalensis]|uniref:phosphoribosyl-ATP pyrophosphohydrolase n=1 Tax=Robertmurraya TaxID=2837507 RepID=UPI0039A43743
MPVYNKLVRDKIPEIIKSAGKECRTKELIEFEYIKELKIKLIEEVNEYQEAETDEQAIEELADILEIIHSLTTVHGGDFATLDAIRMKKFNERGGFQKKILLIDVDDHR